MVRNDGAGVIAGFIKIHLLISNNDVWQVTNLPRWAYNPHKDEKDEE